MDEYIPLRDNGHGFRNSKYIINEEILAIQNVTLRMLTAPLVSLKSVVDYANVFIC